MQFRPNPEALPQPAPMLGAFAHPAFAVVWTASTFGLIGIAMYDTAAGWLMTTFGLDPFEVALLHAATTLPIFLFTLPAGAIAVQALAKHGVTIRDEEQCEWSAEDDRREAGERRSAPRFPRRSRRNRTGRTGPSPPEPR